MSANAIAAVTAALRNLLSDGVKVEAGLEDTVVTTLPMDRARDASGSGNQLNVFLYQATPNAAWRNLSMPTQVQSLETGFPPLALNLYYLITAWGRDNDAQSPFSHFLLGRAMSVMHDHPLLGSDEIRLALPGNDAYLQVERIRFSLQPLSVEDIFKLWSGFQTQYRLSASYEASVVLIESTRAARTPLPVLARGTGDVGPVALARMDPGLPTLQSVMPPNQQSGAVIGDVVTISGTLLVGDKVEVVFAHAALQNPIRVPAGPNASATRIDVQLDTTQFPWVAGWYAVTVEITTTPDQPNPPVHSTNALPMALAPTMTNTMPLKATISTNGTATVKLKCSPDVQPGQRVALLLDDQEIPAAARTDPVASLSFPVPQAVAGTYLIRLRVDGVDSLLVDRTVTPPVYRNHKVVFK